MGGFDHFLWVEENEAQAVWNMLSAMALLNGGRIEARPAVLVQTDGEMADAVRRCLEASGLRMVEEKLSAIGLQPSAREEDMMLDKWVRPMWHVDFAKELDAPVVAGIERHEDVFGQVTYQAVDVDGKSVDLMSQQKEALARLGEVLPGAVEEADRRVGDMLGEMVHVAEEVHGKKNGTDKLPVCDVCGEEFEPARRSAKVCYKPECQAEAQRRYAREYYQKKKAVSRGEPSAISQNRIGSPLNNFQTLKALPEEVENGTAEARSAQRGAEEKSEYKEGEANAGFPWRLVDGPDGGRCVSTETLEMWKKIGRVQVGTLVDHWKRGRHMVDRADGKRELILRKVARHE